MGRAAKESSRSLSQEVEHRLRLSIRQDRDLNHQRHIRALAKAIALLTQQVKRATGKCWRDDPFTGEALRHAIEFLISHYAPRGAIEVPAPVEAAAARVPPAARDSSLTPIGVGHTQAGWLISWIEMDLDQGWRLSRSHVPGYHVPDEWYAYSELFYDLGSGWRRAQNSMQKERSR